MQSNALSVKKQFASKAIVFLKENGLFDGSFKALHEGETVFFPVKKISLKQKAFLDKSFGARTVKRPLEKSSKPKQSLKEFLAGRLSKKEFSVLVSSFDTLGDIAIIEVPKVLEKKEKIIAGAVLELNNGIKTVCKKTAPHSGEFRAEPVKVIAGKKNLTATYRESGCVFKISLGKVFFSPRLSTERLRIAREIKKGEIVGALFAGVGPFPIVFAKNSPMQKAFAVELNPVAVKDLKENIKLNKAEEKVEPILGDVRKVVPKMLSGKCDRVVMPLPKGGETFLREAIACIRPEGGTVHFYDFVPKDNPFEGTLEKIKKAVKNAGRKVKILRKNRVRDFSPSTMQVVVDFWVD